jgi:hypothetical protein
MLISKPNEQILHDHLGKEFYEKVKKHNPELVNQLLLFKPHPSVKRVVFIAVPHRGSALADSWIGQTAAAMVQLPKNILELNKEILKSLPLSQQDKPDDKINILTGIDNLAPDNLALRLLNSFPLADVPLHSIIGNTDGGSIPGGSDGVVPYSSSHLDGVKSEKVVRSGHSVQQNPLAIQEIRRILREHLKTFPDIEMEPK